MSTVTAKLVKYAAEKNIYSHLFFIPITVYTMPDMSNITPAKPVAGVIAGWMGKGLVEFGTYVAEAEAVLGTDVDGAWMIVVDVTKTEDVFASLPVAFDVCWKEVEAVAVAFAEPSED